MLILEGHDYVFIHRSFQEYYAASFVSKMLEDEQEEFCSDYINNSEDENNRVCEILEGGYPEDFNTACMLLLDNQPGAEYHYAKIPEDQKDFFRSLPIYHFWKQ